MTTNEPTWHVYQLRSETELLYVGYSRRLKRRLQEHRRKQPWWPEVTIIRAEQFSSEDAARQREKGIWATGSPKYNRVSPFTTIEESAAAARARVRAWVRDNPEHVREYNRQYAAENYEVLRAYHRQWSRRNRPTTVEGRRARRWRQSGPGLF